MGRDVNGLMGEEVVPQHKLSAADWLAKHTAVSDDEFVREPHRNRYTVMLSRTSHIAFHYGQAILAKPRG